jgi:hypothetical protein
MTMKAPKNTETDAKNNPTGFLLRAMVSRSPVEDQEAEGQSDFVGSDTFPTDIQSAFVGDERVDAKMILEGFGIQFLGPVDGDDLFQYVRLPAGWKKERTDHSMWSRLVDERGRERAAIFYKAAFYDRSAHISVTRRFSMGKDYDSKDAVVMRVKDCDRVVFETAPRAHAAKDWAVIEELEKAAQAECDAWLGERYPDWQSPAAYWE